MECRNKGKEGGGVKRAIMSDEERYLNDPVFHSLVDTIQILIKKHDYSWEQFQTAINLAIGLNMKDRLKDMSKQ